MRNKKWSVEQDSREYIISMCVVFIVITVLCMLLTKKDVQIVEVPVPFAIEQPVVIEQVPYQVNAWYTSDDLYVLAEALYFESAIESLDCQVAVGYTIMNRVKKRKQTIRKVIWADSQFSYTQDGKHERMLDRPARERAFAVAKLVLDGFARDKTHGGEYFYNPSIVDWKFKDDYTFTMTCNHHDFYR